ncbi:MAG: 2-oxo acid dehydrogenase subunit E2 [Oligoflexia bacterium]|nr:2-oxo acid dehydrogenase subunit E2 [Oligoflexia bacterium]
MKTEMVMPQMGESIAEATISKWLKKVGDTVKKDEIILEISTDKVDSEIPAPSSGTITEIRFKEGDVVPVKTVIATIDSAAAGGTAVAPSRPAAAPSAASAGMHVAAATPESRPAANKSGTNGHGVHQEVEESDRFFSPLVKSLAEKHGVPLSELAAVTGSGQGGRLNKQDFLSYLETRGSAKAAAPASRPTPAAAANPTATKAPAPQIDWEADGSKVVVMDNMRQAIAEHMVRSKHTSPHVYSTQEVDCSRISAYRAKHQATFLENEGFKLSFTPFFLEAAVKGLLQFPYINSSIDGKKIILKKHINLGCAVALGNSGLIVPVIKRAEEKNFVGLARSLNDLALRARNKKLLPDDVTGGSFTVTNPGVFGTIIGTPIINQPQVAILCLGAIKKRPVVVDDMIAIREICYLTLSYDHRIVDGSLAGQYLQFVTQYLESWDLARPLF